MINSENKELKTSIIACLILSAGVTLCYVVLWGWKTYNWHWCTNSALKCKYLHNTAAGNQRKQDFSLSIHYYFSQPLHRSYLLFTRLSHYFSFFFKPSKSKTTAHSDCLTSIYMYLLTHPFVFHSFTFSCVKRKFYCAIMTGLLEE